MKFSELLRLLEGGNAEVINKKTGETRTAHKIDFERLPIKKFRKDFYDLFKELNNLYNKKFKEPLWKDLKDIESGMLFNGSTSYIMNPDLSPEEILKYKKSAGDLDIIVPGETLENIWHLLDELEGKKVSHFIYHGCNKKTPKSIGLQINTIFEHIETSVNCQIDFEGLPFDGDKPSEFAKFGHSSSFEDAKENIKAVHHKYILRAIVNALSENPDIVIATPASTPEKIRLKKMEGAPKTMAFSVDRGMRTTLEPMLDKDGQPVYHEGKQVFKEKKTSDSEYISSIDKIIHYIFGIDVPRKDFTSFIGVIGLIKKHFGKDLIDNIHERYFKSLFGKGAQKIEVRDTQHDYDVKISGYNYFLKQLKLKNPRVEKAIQDYYGSEFDSLVL